MDFREFLKENKDCRMYLTDCCKELCKMKSFRYTDDLDLISYSRDMFYAGRMFENATNYVGEKFSKRELTYEEYSNIINCIYKVTEKRFYEKGW